MSRAKTVGGAKSKRAGTVSEKKNHNDSSLIILDGTEPILEITDLPELVPLQIAVHEVAPQLTAVAQAITSSGHVLTLGTSGKEGVAKIRETVSDGQIDVVHMATEIDQERFLVLLPYTDLTGAAEVARRIIAAVADGDPVVATGRTFAPKLVGSVAGGSPGQQVSFSKLMRDATRALEQARKDGADLAVSVGNPP